MGTIVKCIWVFYIFKIDFKILGYVYQYIENKNILKNLFIYFSKCQMQKSMFYFICYLLFSLVLCKCSHYKK
jgi:hypothetical protein